MVTNSINLTIHETYDLNTKVDKVTLLAIRTPSFKTISRYVSPRNWSKIKFNRASFRLACVSQLPVDPLGVGFDSGQISPQELINPILFKTVTGESLGPILDVIYGPSATHEGGSLRDFEASEVNTVVLGDSVVKAANPMNMYYTLLGDDSFRQAHPQQGLVANDLIPLVREMYATMPLSRTGAGDVGMAGTSSPNNEYQVASFANGVIGAEPSVPGNIQNSAWATGRIISGRTVPMPAIDTMPGSKVWGSDAISYPTTYVGLCIMPPSVMRSLYYRCIVSWNITLSGFVPTFRRTADQSTNVDDMYSDWIERPVSNAVAVASQLWEDDGLIATDGMENVTKVTENIS